MASNSTMQPHNLARFLFCCRVMEPINRIGTFNEEITNFTETILHGADTANPVMLDGDEADLIDQAPYIISYEKRWGGYHTSETAEGVRYFIPEPETGHFLEIPTEMFKDKHQAQPFHHDVNYIKYNCRMDVGYLFVCRKLAR